MKRIIAIFTAIALVAAFATVPAFADYSLPADDKIMYDDVQSKSDYAEQEVPVWGYIGEDAEIDDGGTPTTYIINVSVPTLILWAAFETDTGSVTAPSYTIKNLSTKNEVDIVMTSFTATGSDNAVVDKNLTLGVKVGSAPAIPVVTPGTVAGYPAVDKEFGTLAKRTEAGDSLTFSFEGSWSGDFEDGPYSPLYSMTLTFSVPTP